MAETTTPGNPAVDVKNREEGKKLINLLRGWPSPRLLPIVQLRAAANRALSDPAISIPALQYAPDPGYQPLREELARWLTRQYQSSRDISADEIAITGGASQSIACILQSFTDPAYTRAVWAVAPCYYLACPIFEDAGFAGRLRAVPEDEGGIDLGALERGLREVEEANKGKEDQPLFKSPSPHRKLYRYIIYLVATSANPSGKTLSLPRRRRLVHLAREYNALIISDDVYDLLQWPTSVSHSHSPSSPPTPLVPLPLLSQIDLALPPSAHNPPGPRHFSHAVSNSSFSKLVGPGTRTGWIHASPAFVHGFSQTGTNRSGGAASQLAAAMVHQLMAAGELDAHLTRTVRPALQRRHALVVEAVGRELGPLGVRVWAGNGAAGAGTAATTAAAAAAASAAATAAPSGADGTDGVFGGYFVWLTLPEGMPDAREIAERAEQEENLIVAPGRLFEVLGDEETARFPRNIRLCFSWEEEEDVVEGVRRLGRVLRRMCDQP
ncbi:Valine--pyruvate aminotransferase [Madurella fahalii]|uniref:Valine--pyruvate aminotransferase n=1 Tax=Madurella fahalii TaxID=1157608 RepID=A0ABQ0GG54_9PEZI